MARTIAATEMPRSRNDDVSCCGHADVTTFAIDFQEIMNAQEADSKYAQKAESARYAIQPRCALLGVRSIFCAMRGDMHAFSQAFSHAATAFFIAI